MRMLTIILKSRISPFLLHTKSTIVKRFYAWLFLFQGPDLIQDGYNKVIILQRVFTRGKKKILTFNRPTETPSEFSCLRTVIFSCRLQDI